MQERQQAQRYNQQRKSAAGDSSVDNDTPKQQDRAADDGGASASVAVGGVAGMLQKLRGALLPVQEGGSEAGTDGHPRTGGGGRSGRPRSSGGGGSGGGAENGPLDVETGLAGEEAEAPNGAGVGGSGAGRTPSTEDVHGPSNGDGGSRVKYALLYQGSAVVVRQTPQAVCIKTPIASRDLVGN